MPNKINLKSLSTEEHAIKFEKLDTLQTLDQLKIVNEEDNKVAQAIQVSLESIARVVDACFMVLKQGGRIFYVGAGTSGRLGVLDASEIFPTFGEQNYFVALIAGGQRALIQAIEDAEDSVEKGSDDLQAKQLTKHDLVLGVSASGRTPYVIGALKYAQKINAKTASLSTSYNSEISKLVELPIEVVVGPEVISGSTRLKSGTAQKMVLNMISTITMVKMGKTYQGWMVDLKPTNEKLVSRAIDMIVKLAKVDDDEAKLLLKSAHFNVKIALVMFFQKVGFEQAKTILKNNENRLRGLINERW